MTFDACLMVHGFFFHIASGFLHIASIFFLPMWYVSKVISHVADGKTGLENGNESMYVTMIDSSVINGENYGILKRFPSECSEVESIEFKAIEHEGALDSKIFSP